MNCEQAQPLLDAYLDGELEPEKKAQVEQHIAGCAECAAALARLRRLQELFIAKAPHYPAPPELRNKILAGLEAEKRRRFMALARLPWLCAGALLILSICLAWPHFFPNRESRVAHQAVSNYVRAAILEHLCDVVSPDPGVVKPWLAGKLDFSPPVVLPGLEFQMRGGRLDVIRKRKVAALVYKRDKDLATVFVWPAAGQPLSQRTWSLRGYQVSAWNGAGLNFVAVSNMSAAGLAELVGRLKNEVK